MRTKLLLLLILFTTLKSFSQSPDTYQGDSIYRVNNIKTRTLFFNWDKAYWRAVDHFDHNGKVYEHAEYDSTGLKCVSKSKFTFDSIWHFIVSQTIYIYGHFDTVARKIIWNDTPDTLHATFEYDARYRVVRKTIIDASGKTSSDHFYYYDPFTINEKFWYPDGGWLEKWIYTDKHFKETRSVFITHRPNGDSSTTTFAVKNDYNKSGALTKRKIKSDPGSDAPLFVDEQDYMYMSNGLLVRRTGFLKNKPGYVIMELFDYKFW